MAWSDWVVIVVVYLAFWVLLSIGEWGFLRCRNLLRDVNRLLNYIAKYPGESHDVD